MTLLSGNKGVVVLRVPCEQIGNCSICLLGGVAKDRNIMVDIRLLHVSWNAVVREDYLQQV